MAAGQERQQGATWITGLSAAGWVSAGCCVWARELPLSYRHSAWGRELCFIQKSFAHGPMGTAAIRDRLEAHAHHLPQAPWARGHRTAAGGNGASYGGWDE